MEFYLPLIWGAVISVGVLMYVLLDGFDLGIGILSVFRKDEVDRGVMMDTVAPFWDGNETWLVLGGGGLLAAFPLAYSIVMPALYIPVLLMLIALVFRGVAFEFRFKSPDARNRQFWERAFFGGSLFAAFAQGLILGGIVQGIETDGRVFTGGAFDWFSPFSVMTGVAVVCGYALLGAGWLIMRTEGALQDWGFKIMKPLLLVVLGFMALVSLWMPVLQTSLPLLGIGADAYTETEIFRRWFSFPNVVFLAPVPIFALVLSFLMVRAIDRRRDYAPFLCGVGLFVLGYIGLGVSLWPNVVPHSVTLWEAAAAPNSQLLILVGVAIFLPLILGYTAYIYWIFRGKVRPGEGYHG